MFTESADIYDLVYSFKNYREESEKIRGLIKIHRPDCKTILDIACGTGEHHKFLKDDFQIDGIDINHQFINLAGTKNTSGTYSVGHMCRFELHKKYDVVTCLFSSIGYLTKL